MSNLRNKEISHKCLKYGSMNGNNFLHLQSTEKTQYFYSTWSHHNKLLVTLVPSTFMFQASWSEDLDYYVDRLIRENRLNSSVLSNPWDSDIMLLHVKLLWLMDGNINIKSLEKVPPNITGSVGSMRNFRSIDTYVMLIWKQIVYWSDNGIITGIIGQQHSATFVNISPSSRKNEIWMQKLLPKIFMRFQIWANNMKYRNR